MNQPGPTASKNLTALLADDDAGIQLPLRALLEQKGFLVTTVNNGVAAVEAVSGNEFSIVLLDIRMPQMDGFEVCNTVKNVLEMKDTYILMLTAKGQEFDKERGKDVGVDYYITKPFDLDDLFEKVVNVLGIEM